MDVEAMVSEETTAPPFLMRVEDTFHLRDRGVVVWGTVLRGSVRVGDMVEIVGLRETTRLARMTGVDMSQVATSEDLVKHLRGETMRLLLGDVTPDEGETMRLLLGDVTPDELERGQVLAAPGSMRAGTRCRAALQFAPDAQGISRPFINVYRVALHIWTTDVYSTIWLPPGKTTIAPGDSFTADLEFTRPVALEPGVPFQIGRFLGTGEILELR